jgi:hypothetical protein
VAGAISYASAVEIHGLPYLGRPSDWRDKETLYISFFSIGEASDINSPVTHEEHKICRLVPSPKRTKTLTSLFKSATTSQIRTEINQWKFNDHQLFEGRRL